MVEEKKENDDRSELTKNQRSLLERVEALALVYSSNAKEIPQKAWPFWFDAVKGSTLNEISDAISDWSKTQSRMMTPSDLFKLLQTQRSLKREQEKAAEVEREHKPLPRNVAQVYLDGMRAAMEKNISADAWAKRDRIKEAYGFALTEFVRRSWRRVLNLPDDYRFGDTNGVFPLDEYPDERRSLYHDCRIHFMRDYTERHGLELVYDKELATKRYSTEALRYKANHDGTPVREAS